MESRPSKYSPRRRVEPSERFSDSPYMSAKIFFENLLLSIFFNNWFLLKNINVKICYILFQYYLKKNMFFLEFKKIK